MTASPTPNGASPSRKSGLDTLRAAAITLVFLFHYRVFVHHPPDLGWASRVGWVGVDLFFVLSGYLIADQIFSGVARGRKFSLPAFYARRALRTLPAFWFVLAFYAVFPGHLDGHSLPPLWRFLSFTQNVDLEVGTAFSHAWSLCVEEQFYLVLPLVVVVGLGVLGGARGGRVQGWAFIVALLLLGNAARAVLWLRYGRVSDGQIGLYHPYIYYATLCRFDEFLPGVAVAMLKNFHRPLWERITRHGQRVLGLGAAATAAMLYLLDRFYEIRGYGYGFAMTAFGYSLMAIAFAVLVVAALSPGSWLHRQRIPGAYPIALWSYSIYLTHKALFSIVTSYLAPWELPRAAMFVIVTLVCIAAGALLYRFVEAPFMALRARRFPTNFPSAPSPLHVSIEEREAALP
jgi:peptidoglycan/LPS O-acetylase OafA/YrhL